AREFGGAERLRVALDSGSAGGALDPRFLEHALAFQRALAHEPEVGSATSLLDRALLPAMRALHDGDPGFAVVPPTREAVETALAAFGDGAPGLFAPGLDPARRALALEVWVDARDTRALERLEARVGALASEHLGRREAASLDGRALVAAHAAAR